MSQTVTMPDGKPLPWPENNSRFRRHATCGVEQFRYAELWVSVLLLPDTALENLADAAECHFRREAKNLYAESLLTDKAARTTWSPKARKQYDDSCIAGVNAQAWADWRDGR